MYNSWFLIFLNAREIAFQIEKRVENEDGVSSGHNVIFVLKIIVLEKPDVETANDNYYLPIKYTIEALKSNYMLQPAEIRYVYVLLSTVLLSYMTL